MILDAQFFLHKKLDLQDIRFERGINPGDPGFSCQNTDKVKLTQGSCFYCNVSDRVIFSDTKFKDSSFSCSTLDFKGNLLMNDFVESAHISEG